MPNVIYSGVTLPDFNSPIVKNLHVTGPREKEAELVAMHARNEAVRAMLALAEGKHPDEVDDAELPSSIRWEEVLEDEE